MPHKAPSQLQTQVTAPCIRAQAAATPFMQLQCQVVTRITIPIHRMPASPPNPVSGWRVSVAHQYQALGDLATLNVTSMQPVDWLTRMRSHTALTGQWSPRQVVSASHSTCPLRLTPSTLPQVARMRTLSPPSASLPRCLQKPLDCCHCHRALEGPRRSGCLALLARAQFGSPHFRIGGGF